MRVYKFGGGTLKTAEAIRAMTEIVRQEEHVFVVVSAFNKMTNVFEALWKSRNMEEAESILDRIVVFHEQLASELFSSADHPCASVFAELFAEIRREIGHLGFVSSDQAYDQLVGYGEILSSTLISTYWRSLGFQHTLLSAREFIITDATHRNARVDWAATEEQIRTVMSASTGVFLTQGFIGGTTDGLMTTLGREGSDYSAAIIGHLLSVSEVVIWKDVPGVMTADPAEFSDTSKMDEITYLEAVELSYFGAKVIHPNTIKPLQNKGIPLIVKSLYAPQLDGTMISAQVGGPPKYPIVIRKGDQVLLSLQPRDFSFIFEEAIARIFRILDRFGVRVNLMQHGAVSLSLVFDWNQEKLDQIIAALMPEFRVLYNTNLNLWTIRHYSSEAIDRVIQGKNVYVEQKSRGTARYVVD